MQSGSCEGGKTELEMQAVPSTMATMQGTQWTEYHPIASLDNYHAFIEFVMPPHTEYYTDLSQTYLYLKIGVLQTNGSNLDGGKQVSVINNFFHSMFSSIDLYLNDKLVTSNTDTYPL